MSETVIWWGKYGLDRRIASKKKRRLGDSAASRYSPVLTIDGAF
jgi:hypothetical protein